MAVLVVGAAIATWLAIEGVRPDGSNSMPTPPRAANEQVRPSDAEIAEARTGGTEVTGQNPAPKGGSLSFGSAEDLYALANAALSAKDPATIHDGWQAATVCMAALHPRSHYEQMAAKSLPQPVSDQQARAAALMVMKCRGFLDNEWSGNSELRGRLRERLRADGSVYFPASAGAPPTPAQFTSMLDRQDWATLPLLAQRFSKKILGDDGLLSQFTEMGGYLAAWQLIACDMGRNCTGSDPEYLVHCLDSGNCNGSVIDNLKEKMSPAEWESAQRWRLKMGKAIAERDLSFFGVE
ncbi:hypothetical protein ABXN37_26015 [Piscinibacter sakaiensis]|uniref:hypothetical protein n=1 Tax=Piscinibacter sakaiensis TaxID=1547922 RepID=UPI0012FA51FA|nr:hypothetical protein [Piscinibacter sakaiensis]